MKIISVDVETAGLVAGKHHALFDAWWNVYAFQYLDRII